MTRQAEVKSSKIDGAVRNKVVNEETGKVNGAVHDKEVSEITNKVVGAVQTKEDKAREVQTHSKSSGKNTTRKWVDNAFVSEQESPPQRSQIELKRRKKMVMKWWRLWRPCPKMRR